MKTITATELRKRINYYIKLSQKEDVQVTKYGKVITTMTSPKKYFKQEKERAELEKRILAAIREKQSNKE